MSCKVIRLFLVLILSGPWQGHAQSIIVNSINPQTEISRNTLRSIYSMKLRTWQNGTPITVFILSPDSDAHQKFCRQSLGIFAYQLQKKWDVMIFSGTGQSPIVVTSSSEMLKRVSQIPGAIGYILNEEVVENVKPVLVH